MRHRLGIAVTVVFLLASARSAASEPLPACDPQAPCHLRMREDTTLSKDDGTQYRLPPGRFLDEGTWQDLDQEMKRLQDQETRIEAENKSLRESLETWKPGWIAITTAIVVGAGVGVGGYYWYTHR